VGLGTGFGADDNNNKKNETAKNYNPQHFSYFLMLVYWTAAIKG
jgi:hypothetical protein